MASGVLAGSSSHLVRLFDHGTTVGLDDGALLARYAAERDAVAFEALVTRHGPMVLSTCRAVLKHEQDVEDAFQSTFLVLARRAGSIRAGDALGGWLNRVAFRTAVQASNQSRRRRRHEMAAAAMTTLGMVSAGPEPDVARIVHEEIDRLPERERLPIVLCDLEGLTVQQAACRLRWTEPTLRHRLLKARCRLRDRLTRRGFTAVAVGAVLEASVTAARSPVPLVLARSALSAASGGAASTMAVALSAKIARSLLTARLRTTAAGIVAVAALASAGALAVGAGGPEPSKPEVRMQSGTAMQRPPDAAGAPTALSRGAMIEVRGQVVDPQGRPAAKAAIQAVYPGANREVQPGPESTGADGRFFLRVSPPRYVFDSLRADAMRARGNAPPWIIAYAREFGPGKASASRKPGDPDDLVIRLVEAGPPIEGRIVDLEGRPVAGARVNVNLLWYPRQGTLSDWLAHATDREAQNPWAGLELLPTIAANPIAAHTAPDGRFSLGGIGRDRIAEIVVASPTIASAELRVLTSDGPAVSIVEHGRGMTPRRTAYYPRRFEYAVAPGRSIEGIVRDNDSGLPLAGITLRGIPLQDDSPLNAPEVRAKTDAHGHYRLDGLPRAASFEVSIEPGPGRPYPQLELKVSADPAGSESVPFDIALKRGIRVRGRVTDKVTGLPVGGFVNAHPLRDNPHVGEFPGYAADLRTMAFLNDEGRFELVAVPGRNIIGCRSDTGRYRAGVGADMIKGFDPKYAGVGGFDAIGMCTLSDYNVVAEVEIDPKAESATVDLQVDPGRTITVTAVDPEGRPIGGLKAVGLAPFGGEYEQDSPTFEVRALDPSRPRRVTVTHAGRKLAGSIELRGDEGRPMTVRLQPWGVITGRVVDDDGEPREGLEVYHIRVGPDGRFRLEGLVPGRKYEASAVEGFRGLGKIFQDVTVGPGETKDLGDLRVIPPPGG